jgi:hypothetical protein
LPFAAGCFFPEPDPEHAYKSSARTARTASRTKTRRRQ